MPKDLPASTAWMPALGFAVWKMSPGTMSKAHTHSDVEINFLTAGHCRYFLAGRFETLNAGEIALFWAGIPHQMVEKSPDAAGIWSTLPLDWVLRWQGTARMAEKLLRGEVLKTAARAQDQETQARWIDDLSGKRPDTARIAALEIEAWLSRLALQLRPLRAGRQLSAATPEKIGQITDFLASHYTEDIRVDDVARAVTLHPKYLLALFRKHCHMPLWEYVMRLRLAHAQRLLLMTDRTVTDVAMEAGFGSLSAFYLAFRKFMPGAVPREFRSSAGACNQAG